MRSGTEGENGRRQSGTRPGEKAPSCTPSLGGEPTGRDAGGAVWRPCDGHLSHDAVANGAEALLRRLVSQMEGVSWQLEARCAQTDPDAFFPDRGRSAQDAKRVCADCAVREECLDWAIEHNERFGIWGGMSQQERRRLRRARRS